MVRCQKTGWECTWLLVLYLGSLPLIQILFQQKLEALSFLARTGGPLLLERYPGAGPLFLSETQEKNARKSRHHYRKSSLRRRTVQAGPVFNLGRNAPVELKSFGGDKHTAQSWEQRWRWITVHSSCELKSLAEVLRVLIGQPCSEQRVDDCTLQVWGFDLRRGGYHSNTTPCT